MGLIIDEIDTNIELEQYIYALGEITNPKNIINVSKISRNRIRIYLKNKTIIDDITNTYKTIKVNNIEFPIRPLQTRSTRLLISNACPEISHETIINELKKLNLQPTSEMYFLRAGLKKSGFEHITSARRYIYIENNFDVLPETTTIEHNGHPNRIFISDDSSFCLFCKRYGHTIDSCKLKQTKDNETDNSQQTQEDTQTQNEPQPSENNSLTCETEKQQITETLQEHIEEQRIIQQEENQSKDPEYELLIIEGQSPQETQVHNEQQGSHIGATQKRRRSKTNSAESLNGNDAQEGNSTEQPSNTYETEEPIKKSTKNRRTRSNSPCTPSKEWLTPLKDIFTKKDRKITMYQFQNFIDLAHNSDNVYDLSKNYVEEPDTLIDIMTDLYNETNNRSAKVRLTKITNKLQQQANKKNQN